MTIAFRNMEIGSTDHDRAISGGTGSRKHARAALEGDDFPFHSGAVEYYQDNDAWDDSLPTPE